ncbi:M48 family metalloprotease [bacterium]
MKHIIETAIIAIAIVISFAGYSTAGILDVSESKEIRIGEEAAQTLINHYGLVENQAEIQRLEGISDHLIEASGRPELEYHFYIIDTDFVNAFALPGGYIFLTRGLMDFVDNDDELASVICHELVHVAHRHGVVMYKKSLKNMVMNFIVLALTKDPKLLMAGQMYQQSRMDIFGRSAEVEADTFGLKYMLSAGYNPHSSLRFLENMERESTHHPNLLEDYFDFHPPMDERKKIMKDEYVKLGIEVPVGRKNHISERIVVKESCKSEGGCTVSLRGRKKDIMVIGDTGTLGNVYDRARAVSGSLNDLLDSGVRMFETEKRMTGDEWSLWARNIMIVKVLPGDVEANSAGGTEELADTWLKNIKMFLWNDFIKDDI